MEIADASVIVSGGANGLGAATATLLAERGAKVAIFDLDEEKGSLLAGKIGGLFVKASVTNETEVEAGLDAVESRNGTARILINCAGIAPSLMVVRREGPHPMDAFRRTIEVNLVGSFLMSARFTDRLVVESLIGEERGVIINTASIAAFDGHVGHAAYASSKAGVVGMTLPLARELCAHAIRVMAIAPGLFDTAMMDNVPGASRQALATQVPHPSRLGKPEEFAWLVESIIRNPMLNAEVIRIDGGLRLGPQ